MSRNFRALAEFLEVRYPALRGQVHGSNYPPPPLALFAVQAAQLVQWSALTLMLMGDSVFTTLGINPTPGWYGQMKENKLNTFVGVFFMNSMAQSMTATGAFEVTVDGVLVYSKLSTGRMPSAGDLTAGLEKIGLVARE